VLEAQVVGHGGAISTVGAAVTSRHVSSQLDVVGRNRLSEAAANRTRTVETTPVTGTPGILIGALWGVIGFCLAVLRSCDSVWCGLAVGPPLLATLPFAGWWLFGRALLVVALIHRHTRGRRGILIRSDSPGWTERIASRWLPVMGDRVFVLNWSARAQWTNTVPVLVWKHFCGHYEKAGTFRDFNPALIVFRGIRHPVVFRCYPVFRAAGRGDLKPLEEMEQGMLRALGV
jgi:hypothetical protein